MKTNFTCLFLSLFIFISARSQTLTIQNNSNLFISAGSLLSIDSLGLQPSADFNITAPNAITKAATVLHPIANPYISRVFQFANTLPSFSGTITIYYKDTELNSIPENNLQLNVHNGDVWTAYTANVSRDAVANYVATASISNVNLNELTLASQNTSLPLHWLNVTAHARAANNIVQWATSDEVAVKDFTLQKSINGAAWINEGSPVNASNTPGIHNYSYLDTKRYEPLTWYRIVETDLNGHTFYSPVVSVKTAGSNSIMLLPNPAHDLLQIKSSSYSITSVTVYNAAGNKVYAANGGSNAVSVPVANLPNGFYVLTITVNDKTESAGFIKN